MAKAKKAAHVAAPENKVKAPEKKPGVTHVVKVPFADKNNFNKKFEVGENVSHFDKDRLAYLVSEGLAEKVL